jgi:hypothetical protein
MIKSEPTNRLLAPNIFLFAYHLKKESNSFWQKCDALFNDFTTETLTGNLDFSSTNRFLNKEAIFFTPSNFPNLEGYAQPWQTQDSYALFFNIGYDDEKEVLEEVDFETLKKLNPKDFLLLPEKENDKFLGKTLLITAYLATRNQQQNAEYLRELADNCYQALFDDENAAFSRSGELFGSSIFEYGKRNSSRHVLIWLYRDENADKQFKKCLTFLNNLLFYRAKIVKFFNDTRPIYQKLDGEYYQIEKNLDDLQEKLDKHCDTSTSDYYLEDFKTQLKYFAQESLTYTRLLRKMEDFSKTIEINLFNYNETINLISEKLEIEKQELSFLQYFGTETAPHFRRQIQADLGYFQHGIDLISQAIASIRGIVEIDQAQRDRELIELEKQQQKAEAERNEALEDQIQAVGVGIAAGAIVASTAGLMTQPWTLPSRDRPLPPPHPFILALVASVVCACGAWWLMHEVIKRRRSAKG